MRSERGSCRVLCGRVAAERAEQDSPGVCNSSGTGMVFSTEGKHCWSLAETRAL